MKLWNVGGAVIRLIVVFGLLGATAGCKSEQELRREKVAERAGTYLEHMNGIRFESAAEMTTPEDQAAAADTEDVSGLLKAGQVLSIEPAIDVKRVSIDESGRGATVVLVVERDTPIEHELDLTRSEGR